MVCRKTPLMVCNVNQLSWSAQDDANDTTLAGFARPLPPNPHPDVPYVVVLLKMLSVADHRREEDGTEG